MLRALPVALLALALSAARCAGTADAPAPTPTPPAPDTSAPPAPRRAPRTPSPTPELGRPFELDQGARAAVDGLEVTFVEVVENSRCPEDVDCVWAGRAVIRLALRSGEETGEALPELTGVSDEPVPVEALGHRFTLRTLLFDPPYQPNPMPVATLVVERVGP